MQFVYDLSYTIFIILEIVIGFYLLLPLLSVLMYGMLNLLNINRPFDKKPFITDKNFEFGIIITAHQETQFIFPLVDSLLKQQYQNFYAYVVADDCDITDLVFKDPRIIVLRPDSPLNAKIKSIQYAFDNFIKKHDAVMIFDADNLVHPAFLKIVNDHFRKGYEVVQTNFKPKNTDTNFSRMDAIGDMFNFFIEREIRMRLGLSATIWGSGVAFSQRLYEGIKYKDLLGGFDKKLQSHLVKNVNRITFAPDAILFDEKVSNGKSLENQRTRWIHAYFKYFGDSWNVLAKGLREFNFNLIYFGFNLLRPPLFIVMAIAFLITIINYFFDPLASGIWIGIFISFVLSFIVIIAMKGKDVRFIKTLLFMPLFVARQFAAVIKLKKAKKSFIKTEHTNLVYIDDLI